MVILTSKASASAAEIVAQALQDYGTALIVGDERTYGKGTIQFQTVTDDDAKAFFKVTVGKYYTVSGRSTQIEGVKADIVVPTHYASFNIGERFLEYPLNSDQIASVYSDPLTDIDEQSRRWFQKNYLPNIQKKQSMWRQMLSVLKTNSQYRLDHNPNFKLYLSRLQNSRGEIPSPASQKENWGAQDLQMQEVVNILKDMIFKQTVFSP
jgi:carboxyl-terminal processing protease